MTKQEEITAKVEELTEAVAAAKGSVLVIGIADGEAEDEKVVIGAIRGNGGQLIEATTKLLTSDEGAPVAHILRNAMTIVALHKIAGGRINNTTVLTLKK